MYITYEAVQFTNKGNWKRPNYIQRHRPSKTIPNKLPKFEFMPTKLVRISDLKVVDGSQVNEGYCALSYSWNQSGNIQKDEIKEKYICVDEGKHKIVFYDTIYPDMIIPRYKINLNLRLTKIYKVLKIMDDNDYFFSKTIKYTKFKGIIQQISQQFNIKYIWYDQMCISQNDPEERRNEIRNMHHIYNNAYCTVALVLDYHNYAHSFSFYSHPLGEQQYFKRLWTLEEAVKSNRLLFVGRDIHEWEEDIDINDSTYQLMKSFSELNIHEILYHAHQRTSTREHDRVFALINFFPEFIDEISIDYHQPIENLMVQFYRLLAKKDISILFFGKIGKHYESTIQHYTFLPSWTGVHGAHVIKCNEFTSFQDYNVVGKTMHITSAYVTNDRSSTNNDSSIVHDKYDIAYYTDNGYIKSSVFNRYYRLCILIQLSGKKENKRIKLAYYNDEYKSCRDIYTHERVIDLISKELQQLSRFMTIKMENLCWCHVDSIDYQSAASIDLNGLMEHVLDNPSTQYVILSEISFGRYYNRYYPVIKKEQGEQYYKAIGCVHIVLKDNLFSGGNLFSGCTLPKQTFIIQ